LSIAFGHATNLERLAHFFQFPYFILGVAGQIV